MKGSAVGYVWDYVAWNAMILRLPQPSPFESDTRMPIGIRPINDFAYKKIFGSPENKLILISLLNAILNLSNPIIDVTIVNPYNLQDFKDDKLSILDIKAVDQDGAIYDIEMQLSIFSGLIKRIVFYGCEIFAGQLKAGDDYSKLKPVYSICLLEKKLWDDSPKVHHAYRLKDALSGRILIKAYPVFRGGLKKPLRNYLASFLTPYDYAPKNQLKTLRLRTSWISLMILPHMILS